VKPRASFFLFAPGGVPIYAHATLPLGLALASQFSWQPYTWLGLVFVILVHEGGHALLLHRYRLPVLAIVLHGFGGECQTVSWMSPWQETIVAWGGVLAQFALLVVVTGIGSLGLWPRQFVASDFYFALTAVNFIIAVFNLLPFGNLDGRRAWRILWFGVLRAKHSWLAVRLSRATSRRTKARNSSSVTSLDKYRRRR
jgi:Zn-dependent protease